MGNVKVVLNRNGVRDMLRSEDAMRVCREGAESIMSNYGSDAELSEYVGKNRVNVSIYAPFEEAAEDNKLLKAVHK